MLESSRFLNFAQERNKNGATSELNNVAQRFFPKSTHGPQPFSYEQLNALADGLSADGAGLQRGAALNAGGVAALEDQFDVVVDADGACDPLLHLPVARLQLLQQVVLLRVLRAGAAVHFCLVCEGQGESVSGTVKTYINTIKV